MPPVLSKPTVVGFILSIAGTAVAIRKYGEQSSVADHRLPKLFVEGAATSKSKDKVAVDALFLKRTWRLLKIVCPGLLTPEFAYAVLVAVMLVRGGWGRGPCVPRWLGSPSRDCALCPPPPPRSWLARTVTCG